MRKVILLADIYESATNLNKQDKQEWESKRSIDYLLETIENLGYKTVLIEPYNSKLSVIESIKSILEDSNIENYILFNLIEGYKSRNREAYIPSIGEFFGIAYTGSDTYAQCVSLDKNLIKQIVKNLRIPVKHSILLENGNPLPSNVRYPIFVKPNGEGSSLGISEFSIIQNEKELVSLLPTLFTEYESVLLEELLVGDDLTLGVIGNYPKYETTLVANLSYPTNVYNEEIKSKESMPEKLSFTLDKKLEKKIQEDSIIICKSLKVSGYARLDWKLDSMGNPFFLEINLTPGLSRFYSTLPICFESNNGNYSDLIKNILQFGYENYNTNKIFTYGRNKNLI